MLTCLEATCGRTEELLPRAACEHSKISVVTDHYVGAFIIEGLIFSDFNMLNSQGVNG